MTKFGGRRSYQPVTRPIALFQTKSLHKFLDRYAVTPEGRLCLVGNGWQDDDPFEGKPGKQEKVDVDLHGDMRMGSADGMYRENVVRFTHGTMEWIRRIADVPQNIRNRV